jgi:hypothetical protein
MSIQYCNVSTAAAMAPRSVLTAVAAAGAAITSVVQQ